MSASVMVSRTFGPESAQRDPQGVGAQASLGDGVSKQLAQVIRGAVRIRTRQRLVM
jgi:hypothetical protein